MCVCARVRMCALHTDHIHSNTEASISMKNDRTETTKLLGLARRLLHLVAQTATLQHALRGALQDDADIAVRRGALSARRGAEARDRTWPFYSVQLSCEALSLKAGRASLMSTWLKALPAGKCVDRWPADHSVGHLLSTLYPEPCALYFGVQLVRDL